MSKVNTQPTTLSYSVIHGTSWLHQEGATSAERINLIKLKKCQLGMREYMGTMAE